MLVLNGLSTALFWIVQTRSLTPAAALVVALFATGLLSAKLGGSPWRAAAVRLVAGGALAMVVTFGIGALLGTAVA